MELNFQISMHVVLQSYIYLLKTTVSVGVPAREAMAILELCTSYAQWEGQSTSVLPHLSKRA